jgi:hypothetical protein
LRRVTSVATPAGSAATGTDDRNVNGNAVALTVFSAVRWWGRVELPVFTGFLRRGRNSLTELKHLSFIHAARWSLFTEIPYNGPPQPQRRLRSAHLYFESNFNGGWEEYIDAFSYVLRTGMWAFWGSSFGFPGALPSGPFKQYIRANEIDASHYYAAYPGGTATMVLAALDVEPRLEQLKWQATWMSPAEFAAAWRAFLIDTQPAL